MPESVDENLLIYSKLMVHGILSESLTAFFVGSAVVSIGPADGVIIKLLTRNGMSRTADACPRRLSYLLHTMVSRQYNMDCAPGVFLFLLTKKSSLQTQQILDEKISLQVPVHFSIFVGIAIESSRCICSVC